MSWNVYLPEGVIVDITTPSPDFAGFRRLNDLALADWACGQDRGRPGQVGQAPKPHADRGPQVRDGAAIAAALGGKRNGKGWNFRCPCHDDRNPSASIRDDGLCHFLASPAAHAGKSSRRSTS